MNNQPTSRPAPLSQLLNNGGDVLLFCNKCGHNGELPTSVFLEIGATPDTPIIDLARACKCSRCGSNDAQSRPDPYPPGMRGVAGAGDMRKRS